MIGLAVLSYSMDEIRKMYGGVFSIQIHWKVMSNLNFLGSTRKSKLLITSQWIWIEKNPTVHLPYFIHRVRQNCQTNHFPVLRERFLVSFFKILNLKNRWFDDVTWLLSLNFMKDHQGECLGKISHPYRVWKVYTQSFSENTELATGRTLTQTKPLRGHLKISHVPDKRKNLTGKQQSSSFLFCSFFGCFLTWTQSGQTDRCHCFVFVS